LPEQNFQTFSAEDLTWTDRSLWDQFLALRVEDARAPAVIDAEERGWTRGEIHALAERIAARLKEMDVGPHDRVLIEGQKRIATIAAALAVSSLGAIICPYSPTLSAADRGVLESRLGHAARLHYGNEGESLDAETALRIVVAGNRTASDDLRNAETTLIGFTSGTTGIPKAVMHRASAMNYTTRAIAAIAGLRKNDTILGVVPWDSAPGFTFTVHFALSLGHPLVIVDPWSAERALTRASRYRCAWAICVPTHLFSMVEAARAGNWSGTLAFRAVTVGGSSMTPELITDAERLLGIKALRTFGMSECMGHACVRPEDSLERRQNSDGHPFPGTSDEAFDENLAHLPPGSRGQAGVKGPSLFLGYCKGLGDGGAHLTPDGYLLTGDEIICDEDGYLKVVGRIKDQIIRGGFNIDPAEVEAALLRHPAIVETAVVPVPEKRLGEQACAVCVIRAGHDTPNLSALAVHLETVGLSKKKWPEHLMIVAQMPYTSTGKIDKKRLATAAREEIV
jgi:acyl-CoA synthetase